MISKHSALTKILFVKPLVKCFKNEKSIRICWSEESVIKHQNIFDFQTTLQQKSAYQKNHYQTLVCLFGEFFSPLSDRDQHVVQVTQNQLKLFKDLSVCVKHLRSCVSWAETPARITDLSFTTQDRRIKRSNLPNLNPPINLPALYRRYFLYSVSGYRGAFSTNAFSSWAARLASLTSMCWKWTLLHLGLIQIFLPWHFYGRFGQRSVEVALQWNQTSLSLQ